MECPKRCPNKTKCNKKINQCVPKTLKCSRKTDLNKITTHCDPKLSKQPHEYASDDKKFIMLCKKHIMVPSLDNVIQTSWLNSKDCNIFMIGEKHYPHEKCTAILDMFKSLIRENVMGGSPVNFDIMIEYLQKNAVPDKTYLKEDSEIKLYGDEIQLNNLRRFFVKCIKFKNCFMRVHWTDPSQADKLTDWLNEMSYEAIENNGLFKDNWIKNPKIKKHIKKESDISKLITENKIVVKEINKATKVNPNFTLKFVTDLFVKLFNNRKREIGLPWKYLVTLQSRRVMDFYTAARIIKSKMKHVIFYAGNNHTETVIKILTELNFKLIDKINGTCI